MSYGEIKALYNFAELYNGPKAHDNGCSCSELPKDAFKYLW